MGFAVWRHRLLACLGIQVLLLWAFIFGLDLLAFEGYSPPVFKWAILFWVVLNECAVLLALYVNFINRFTWQSPVIFVGYTLYGLFTLESFVLLGHEYLR